MEATHWACVGEKSCSRKASETSSGVILIDFFYRFPSAEWSVCQQTWTRRRIIQEIVMITISRMNSSGAGEANKSLDSKPKRTHWRIVAQKMNENDFHWRWKHRQRLSQVDYNHQKQGKRKDLDNEASLLRSTIFFICSHRYLGFFGIHDSIKNWFMKMPFLLSEAPRCCGFNVQMARQAWAVKQKLLFKIRFISIHKCHINRQHRWILRIWRHEEVVGWKRSRKCHCFSEEKQERASIFHTTRHFLSCQA